MVGKTSVPKRVGGKKEGSGKEEEHAWSQGNKAPLLTCVNRKGDERGVRNGWRRTRRKPNPEKVTCTGRKLQTTERGRTKDQKPFGKSTSGRKRGAHSRKDDPVARKCVKEK